MKIPSDGVLIGSGTLARDLGRITIWNPWPNESDANLEDSACTVRVLLFFSIPSEPQIVVQGQFKPGALQLCSYLRENYGCLGSKRSQIYQEIGKTNKKKNNG